jgi:hypothetical protein
VAVVKQQTSSTARRAAVPASQPKDRLTAKQELFVAGLLAGKTQADAYRAAYDAGGMSDNAIYVAASNLCRNPKITIRLSEAYMSATEKLKISAELLTEMSLEAYQVARTQGNASHMTSAIMTLAKINGTIIERSERRIEQAVPSGDRDALLAELGRLTSGLGIKIVSDDGKEDAPVRH